MFKAVKEADDYGNKQTHYYLTQGDSCTITATPYKNGVVANDVKSCTFKLATSDYKLVKRIVVTTPSSGSYAIKLSSTDTSGLNAGSYIYEIEYTMNDDSVQTPHSWKFDILKQITD